MRRGTIPFDLSPAELCLLFPDAPPKLLWMSGETRSTEALAGGRKSVCDQKSTETLQAEICSALLPLCQRS